MDNISFSEMEKRVELIKHYGVFKTVRVFSSPSLDGFHIEITMFWKLSKRVQYQYRFDFGDDLRRLCLDMISEDFGVREVLFDYKIKHKLGVTMKFERKLMFIWNRASPYDEWQKNPKQKNILTFIARQ